MERVPPSVIACGDATFPKGTASAAAAKFPSQPKGVPLGELANVVSLRGWLQHVEAPPFIAKGCFLSNRHAIIDERCYFLYTKLISTGTIFLLCQWLLRRNK